MPRARSFANRSRLAEEHELLLELALAAGGSLDPGRVCGEFLRLLVSRGVSSAAGIWHVAAFEGPSATALRSARSWRAHSFPPDAFSALDLSNILTMLARIEGGDPSIVPAPDLVRLQLLARRPEPRQVALLLPLDAVGFLAAVQKNRTEAKAHLGALPRLAGHLAASLRGCLAYGALADAAAGGAHPAAGRARMNEASVRDIAHWLSGPLTAVLGFAELLLSRELPAGRRRELLRVLQSEAQRMEERLRRWRFAAAGSAATNDAPSLSKD